MNDKFQLVIAALLHDIGKLGYRAGVRGAHYEIGRDILQGYDNILPGVSSLISLHHQTGIEDLFNTDGYNILKKIIIADWLASSERIGIEKKENVKKIGLTPIFSKISIFEERIHQKLFYSGKSLALKNGSSEIFPLASKELANSLERCYSENWSSFTKNLRRIEEYKDDFDKMFRFLYSLLKKHFKFVPSAAYFVEPDISLFDHSKMVCAIALALHNYFELNLISKEQETNILNRIGQILKELYAKGDIFREEIKKDDSKKEIFVDYSFFTLIHGDFSGIQRFIHLISSKYAMKTLKGRSFFLSLLTENYLQYICDQLDLTQANVIYAGGGHFYMLAHYSKDVESLIREISIKINKLFIEQFNSNLYLALDYIHLSLEDLVFKISEKWREVNLKTSKKKKKKFNEIIKKEKEEYFSKIFGPIEGSARRIQRCIVCNSFENLELMPDTDENWCAMCKSFKDLTNDLKLSNYYRDVRFSSESYNKVFNEFEKAVEFKKDVREEQNEWYSINNSSFESTLGVKQFPIAFPINESGAILRNDELAAQAYQRTGFNKLGILKMDVDSLGKIFLRGLGKDSTISRVSTLSSSLTLFFEGYIPILVQSEFSDSVYLIFSGGDDLFVVGSWDKLIDFSFRLYRDFRRFTAFNPDITLSAGLVIETPTFPIIKAAVSAENELNRAKSFGKFAGRINAKNRISLFGSVLKWNWSLDKEREYNAFSEDGDKIEKYHRNQIFDIMKGEREEEIKEKVVNWINNKSEFELALVLKDILVYLMKKKNIPKSMLHKFESSIRGLRILLEDSLKGRIKVPKLWRLKYYLRSVLRSKDTEVKLLTQFIIQMVEIILFDNLFELDSHLQIKTINFISVAVKWADYLTRL